MFCLLIRWRMQQSAKEWEMWTCDSWIRWHHLVHCFFPFKSVIISSEILFIHSDKDLVYILCTLPQSGLALHLKILQRKTFSSVDKHGQIRFAWSDEVKLLLTTITQLFDSCGRKNKTTIKKTSWLCSPFSSSWEKDVMTDKVYSQKNSVSL